MTPNLFSQQNPPFVFNALISQFLPPRLDGEIGLTLRHNLLVGISVLNNEVAGIARKQHNLDFPDCAIPNLDHFADVSKMVINMMPAIETRQLSLLYYSFEVPVLRVFQDICQVAALPILVIRFVRALDLLERRRMPAGCLFNFLCHYFFPPFFPTLTSTIVIVSFPQMSTPLTAIL